MLAPTFPLCYTIYIVCESALLSTNFEIKTQISSQGGVTHMAHVCEVCNKGELSGNNVSHSHLKTKRSWKPNIQRVRAVVDGEVKRINVCTRCLRSGKVERAL